MRRVHINDGQGIEPEDLIDLGKLPFRNQSRYLLRSSAGVGPTTEVYGTGLFLVRGSDFSLSGAGNRTVALTRGYYIEAPVVPADEDSPEVHLGESVAGNYQLDANTSGSVWRRDIIQARVNAAETLTEFVSRDFEDAATRAVTTQSMNVRAVRHADLQVKKGTDQASEALANANEPAPDAGFTKVYSFLVDNTGSVDAAKVWDWHTPFRRRLWLAHSGNSHTAGTAQPSKTGTDAYGPFFSWPLNTAGAVYGLAFDEGLALGEAWNARLHSIRVLSRARDGASNFEFLLYRPSPGGGDTTVDLTSQVSAPQASDLITNIQLASIPGLAPIWMTGTSNRTLLGVEGQVFFRWTDAGDASVTARLHRLSFNWFEM